MIYPPHEVWVGAMAKHLPPSGSALRLLDVGGDVGETLAHMRPDIVVQPISSDFTDADVAAEGVDAVTVYGQTLTPSLLRAALHSLRRGGRLIALLPQEVPDATWVSLLEDQGYTRILVEAALADSATGVLVRGEKPHTTTDTLARIRVASSQDDTLTDLDHYPGRFLYLLVRQTPNKPVWALRAGESYTWEAVVVPAEDTEALIAFSSLAKAVAFMQPAVLEGHIRDINKVAKYSVGTVRTWDIRVLLNPADGYLARRSIALRSIDPRQAEAADE